MLSRRVTIRGGGSLPGHIISCTAFAQGELFFIEVRGRKMAAGGYIRTVK